MKKDAVSPAIDRLFRAYNEYLEEAGPDTVVNLLTAMHSLDEKIKAVRGEYQFFHVPEYLVLKALRNHIVHSGEVPHLVAPKAPDGMQFVTDLTITCLIGLADWNAALDGIEKKARRAEAEAAFQATAFVYGDKVVDLNPAIFNCIVKFFEKLLELGLEGPGEEFRDFALHYDWETRAGHSHYVNGGVGLHPADVDAYLDWVIAQYDASLA